MVWEAASEVVLEEVAWEVVRLLRLVVVSEVGVSEEQEFREVVLEGIMELSEVEEMVADHINIVRQHLLHIIITQIVLAITTPPRLPELVEAPAEVLSEEQEELV